MEFKQLKPEFSLTLSLDEAVALWKIVNKAKDDGNSNAASFVEALYDFAANSNSYDGY